MADREEGAARTEPATKSAATESRNNRTVTFTYKLVQF